METDSPTYYVMGEEVKLRGVSFGEEQARGGGSFIAITFHVQFPESERTHEVNHSSLKVEGGSTALYDDLNRRGLIPSWVSETKLPPWEREGGEGRF